MVALLLIYMETLVQMKLQCLTLEIEIYSPSQMLLSSHPFKKMCDREEWHLNDIGRGPYGSCPLSMTLFQIISSPSSENDCNILHQK